MWVGCFGSLIFSVSSLAVFTPSNIKGSTGSNWVTHDVIGGKAKSEYVGPKLKSFSFDVTLDSSYGVPPRIMLALMRKMAEEGYVDYLIIGSMPIGMCQYKLTDVSEEWDVVKRGGKLARCQVSLSMEEYK
jgi:phage protein U